MGRMRSLLSVSILVAVLSGCTSAPPRSGQAPDSTETAITAGSGSTEPSATTGAGPTVEPTATTEPAATPGSTSAPTPRATTVSASAGTASTGPGVTVEPNTTPGPSPEPTPVASVPPLVRPDLRYQLVDGLGRPLFCDPDFYPVARLDEAEQARLHLAAIHGDGPTYAAIVAHLGIDVVVTPTDSQVLAIYRDWKMLRALILTETGGPLGFDYIAADGTNDTSGWRVVGTIDTGGSIAVDRRDPSGPPPCPICLARGTWIATPNGPRAVEDLRPGMPVWTSDPAGQRVMGFVIEVGSTPVPTSHQVVHLILADGRTVDVSPGHPLSDGRRLGDLRPGDVVDGATVVSSDLQSYGGGATFDLLPSGPTGTYWANGIHLASTLTPGR
jgi:hypothetical protein